VLERGRDKKKYGKMRKEMRYAPSKRLVYRISGRKRKGNSIWKRETRQIAVVVALPGFLIMTMPAPRVPPLPHFPISRIQAIEKGTSNVLNPSRSDLSE